MPLTFRITEAKTCDQRLVSYAQHMARTARSSEARHLFERFLERENAPPKAEEPAPLPGAASGEASFMLAKVDPVLCTGCGQCTRSCPEVFELSGDRARVRMTSVPPRLEATCLHAMQCCPTDALSLEV